MEYPKNSPSPNVEGFFISVVEPNPSPSQSDPIPSLPAFQMDDIPQIEVSTKTPSLLQKKNHRIRKLKQKVKEFKVLERYLKTKNEN